LTRSFHLNRLSENWGPLLFDNAKSVVLERGAYGPGLHRWNPALLALAEECGFTPRLCRPYRAKTKWVGRLEAGGAALPLIEGFLAVQEFRAVLAGGEVGCRCPERTAARDESRAMSVP
jgi:hypothetical protein